MGIALGHKTLIEAKYDPFVSVCTLGLTWLCLVLAEIWGGEISPTWRFRGDLNRGNGMERQGLKLWLWDANGC